MDKLKRRKTYVVITILFTLICIFSGVKVVKANFEMPHINQCDTSDTSSDTDSGGGGNAGIGGQSYMTKGSEGYKNAKKIFDFLTKKRGWSGAAAAGALGNGARESHFDPTVDNPSGGVHGIFQWSGWKGNSINGQRWSKAPGGMVDTLENEMALLNVELDDPYFKSNMSGVGAMTDVHKAATQFLVYYEGVSPSDPQANDAVTFAAADFFYKEFGGEKIKADTALLDAAGAATDGTAEGGDDSKGEGTCGSASSSDGDGKVVDTAKSLLGYFHYGQIHGVKMIGSVENPDKNGITDCSGFVWLVLKKAGYKVPDDMAWYTMSMEQDAKGDHKYLKEVDASSAKAGDVVIQNTGSGAGNNGHTAILEEDWHGDTTKIIQEGGEGHDGPVNEGTYGNSFMGLGGTPVFAEPVK